MNKMLALAFVAITCLVGCSARTAAPVDRPTATMAALYTPTAIQVDGKLDEPVWKRAQVYHTGLSDDITGQGRQVQEPGEVRLAWDDQYLYVGLTFFDSDLVAQGTSDDQPHFQFGDVGELFLKPQDSTWYWELYVTPAGKKTRYWFPGSGWLGLSTNLNHPSRMVVAAQIQGTLNHWQDRDTCWTAEMAVPVADLTVLGDKFGPGHPWRILIGRYNYSRYLTLPGPEISETPPLRFTSFHRTNEYAKLILEK